MRLYHSGVESETVNCIAVLCHFAVNTENSLLHKPVFLSPFLTNILSSYFFALLVSIMAFGYIYIISYNNLRLLTLTHWLPLALLQMCL